MPHLGDTVATDCDYYTTHLGIRIDTDGQVMEWTHRSGSSSSWRSAAGRITGWQKRQTYLTPQ